MIIPIAVSLEDEAVNLFVGIAGSVFVSLQCIETNDTEVQN